MNAALSASSEAPLNPRFGRVESLSWLRKVSSTALRCTPGRRLPLGGGPVLAVVA